MHTANDQADVTGSAKAAVLYLASEVSNAVTQTQLTAAMGATTV